MQWLIDIIHEMLGVPPVYIPRITGVIADFTQANFTLDGLYHTLDLSGIVPANVSAVNLSIRATCNLAGKIVRFRHPDDSRDQGRCILWTQANGVTQQEVWAQGIDINRHVEYYFSNETWPLIQLLIKGWWL